MTLISTLSDEELLNRTKTLVAEEKLKTQEVLDHLEEIEYRKLYLAKGYSSLLEYCVKELKYSESSAHRRISAMRLIRVIPEAKEKLESGSVNLSTLSQLHGFLKREEKEKTYTKDMRLDLLGKIEGKSQDQCEREFVKISPIEISFREKEKPLTEEFTQMTFVATKELKAKFELLRNLLAHKNSNPTMAELIEMSVDMALKELNPITKKSSQRVSTPDASLNSDPTEEKTKDSSFAFGPAQIEERASNSTSSTVLHCATKPVKSSRYIPALIRQYVWKRDQGCCQYVDKETGKICQSTFAIQIDHIHPFSLGGSNEAANLRLLCRAHNNWRTQDLYTH